MVTLFIDSRVSNTGALVASGGLIDIAGTVTGGKDVISGAGIVDFAAASTASTTFAAGATGKLLLEDSAQYTGTIFGFGANGNTTESIDLADFDFTGAHATSFSLGVLTLKNTAGQVVHLHFSGNYTLGSFHLADDHNFNGVSDGTKITDPPSSTKPQIPPSDALASLFGQSLASWNPITALASEVLHLPLACELQMATNLLHAHG
jgi:hypothetical protein